MVRVVVVDDSEVVRLKLRGLFATAPGTDEMELAGEAADGESGLRLIAEEQPDVVVMDLKMPGMSGIEATWKLGAIAPDSRVLVLTVSEEQEDIADAIMAGAKGYVVKGAPDEEIIEAVRKVATGERAISHQVAAELVDRTMPRRASPEAVRGVEAATARGTIFAGRHLWQSLLIAIVIGAALTGLNHGQEIADGEATSETWIKAGLNAFVVFCVFNIGLLAGKVSDLR